MIPSLPLNDGHSIPQLGLGTYGLWNEEGAATMAAALELGYRHLDTAARYENEDAVGEAIRRAGIPREELFVTTKLDGPWQGDDRAVGGLNDSLERLGLEYVDLLLIHWPLPARDQYVSTWQTFERLKAEGLTRSIGVSNFKATHLDRLAAETGTVPAVNQIQLNPHVARVTEREDHARRGIVTESYSPFGGGGASVLKEPVIVAVAGRLGRTPGQVVAKWHLQQGLVAIPKSGNLDRLRENLDLDFELDEAALAEIATLDTHEGNDSDRVGH
ncbi:aldo/keto reductase [Schumannella luteola]